VLGFSGVTPSRKGPPPTAHTDAGVGRLAVEVTPISFPKLNLVHLHGLENEYQLNMGKAIDSIRRDYPLLLTHGLVDIFRKFRQILKETWCMCTTL
jgi:hypothetical protein